MTKQRNELEGIIECTPDHAEAEGCLSRSAPMDASAALKGKVNLSVAATRSNAKFDAGKKLEPKGVQAVSGRGAVTVSARVTDATKERKTNMSDALKGPYGKCMRACAYFF